MTNTEKEIRKILEMNDGPPNIEEWMNKPCPAFANKTPRFIIDSGDGENLLDKLKGIYRQGKTDVK